MRDSRLKSFFSSGLQAISIQLFGGLFFYLLSIYLSKDHFGTLNKFNATSMFITTVLGCGLEQVVVKRVALNRASDWAAAAYFLHALFGSILTLALLLGFIQFYGSGGDARFLSWIFIAQVFIYIAGPLKQFLNAKEHFTPYGVIAFCSNVLKIIAVIVLNWQDNMSLGAAIGLLIVTSALEFVILFIYIKKKFNFNFSFKFKAYKKLLKESSAQYLAVLFDSSLSRMDWILLGLISAEVVMADYSFAYRAYEMMRLPILIIGPIILPQFARILASPAGITSGKKQEIGQIFRIEAIVGAAIILVVNILWIPVIGGITGDKYGDSNALIFMVLSICLPFHFAVNLFWTLVFSAKKYKQITAITMITAVTNLVLNLVLIPFYGGLGAAIAYTVSTIAQSVIYYYILRSKVMSIAIYPLFIILIIAALAYFIALAVTNTIFIQILIALAIFTGLAVLLRQVGKEQLSIIRTYLKR